MSRSHVVGAWLSAMALALASLVVVLPVQALSQPGTPYTWGGNGFGQLGDGTQTARSTAAVVPGQADVIDLHSGREHIVVLTAQRTVRTWGSNAYGQLGLGGGANRASPADVPGLGDIVSVSTGHYHSMALTADGRIWTWGLNASGQLGDGTRTNRSSPVLVAGVEDAVAIAAGRDMSYAVRADGTAWAWGLNTDNQLGDGTITNRTTPVRVGGLTGIVSLSGGRDHGLAVDGDGAVWAWGWNAYGQIGDGTLTNRATPVRVTSGAVAVAGGAHHSYALMADGSVRSWGRNYRAELGDGSTINRTRPVAVLGVTSAVSLGSGRDHGIAVLADGTVRTWGWNSSGQLGDGTLIDRNLAVAVPGVGGATKVGGGGEGHSVVLVVSATPPQDLAPTASFTHECQALECTFDAASSVDPEGGALSYAWSFGDGSGSSARLITHAFSAAANYTVRLTVTDPGGQTNTLTRQVAVAEAPTGTVAFRAARSSNTSATRPAVTVPAVVQPGDVLLLFATTNRNATMSTPSGWTLLGTRLDGADLESWLFTRLAATDTAGSTITTQLDALSKVSLTLLAYSGAGPVQSSASTGETVVRTTHLSPSVQVSTPGSRVVSHWVDRTDGHTGWTLPASVIGRNNNTGTGSARLTAVTGDSGPVATGTWQGVTATSGASSGKAVSWSVVVPSA